MQQERPQRVGTRRYGRLYDVLAERESPSPGAVEAHRRSEAKGLRDRSERARVRERGKQAGGIA